MAKKLTSKKARKILHDKSVHGNPLTEKQRKFFGAIAGGAEPYKAEGGAWLDKYEQGGLVLKQKTHDNYGTKPNVNDSDVSLPPGFKGWAYNTKGRNYSPAWGGQFQDGGNLRPAMAGASQPLPLYQMGGSLPGAVGFMYARTQNPAPSNGPYAKKTKASAQDGKSVNTNIQEKRYKDIYVPLIDKLVNSAGSDWEKMPLSNTSFIEQLFSGDVKNRNLPPIDPIIKEAQNKILSLPDSEINKLMKVRWRNISAPEALMKTPKGVSYGDMFRYINHFKKLKKQGYTLQNGGEMKYYQEGLDFKPKTISQNGRNITTDINDYNRWKDSVNNYIRGQKDLAKARRDIKKNIDSFSLMSGEGIVGAFSNLIQGDIEGKRRFLPEYKEQSMPKKFWGVEKNYDQVPKDVIVVGDPAFDTSAKIKGLTRSLDENERLAKTNLFPYSGVVEIYHPPVRKNLQYVKPSKPAPKKPVQPVILQEREPKLERPIPIPRETRNLGFNLPTPGVPSFPKLNEYNPNTPTKYSFTYPTGNYNEQKTMYFPTRSAWKSFTEGVRGASSQEGVDYGTSTGNLQDGGNVDPMGYWNPDNWGKPVTIPSNEITMEGVYEPLIGISDTGDVQYMEPGEDYEFDGEYVTEYPVARGGVSVNNADAQPIEKLDQLLNFTNYNKPTKGGWLDKYQ